MNKRNIERRNSINMNNQDIENRLQNIINADKIVSKQLAFKTKRLYKRLNVFANAKVIANHKLHEKRCQLMMAEKMLAEYRDMLASLKDTQKSLGNEVHRLRKKVNDLEKQNSKSEPMTDHDQYVFTKNKLKLRLLGECTKLQYYEAKTSKGITLTGYLSAAGKLHAFQEKIPTNTNDGNTIDVNKPADKSQPVLWNQIKLGSQHLDEWSDLFSMNNAELHTTL